MSASSSPRPAEKFRQVLVQDERDSSETEYNEDEIDDALLDQMLWKAERLANEMKLLAVSGGSQQRDCCDEESISHVNPCYSTVPNSIELDQSKGDAGTDCSSVGWLPAQDCCSHVPSMVDEVETTERSQNVVTPENLRKDITSQPDQEETMKASFEHSRDNCSCNSSKRSDHTSAMQADADISVALKAAQLMKMQLEAVLIDSSQSGGSEENVDSSTSEEENDSDNDDEIEVFSFDNDRHDTGLVVPTSERKERMRRPAAKQLSVPTQMAEDYTVPLADYTRTRTNHTAKPVFEKVEVATVGDQDYVPIQDYSMHPNKKGVPLRDFTFSENHAVVIHQRRFRRRQRRLAVLALFFVTVVVWLLSRRSWDAEPATAPQVMRDSQELVACDQSPMLTTVETSRTVEDVFGFSEGAAPSKVIQNSDDTLCLFLFSSFLSDACSSSTRLKNASEKAQAQAKRREMVENLVQSMMQ